MDPVQLKNQQRKRRKRVIRRRLFGSPDRPRLTIFRSARHIYAQVIDDLAGRTLASASTIEKDHRADNGGNRTAAADVGRVIAQRAKEAGISAVVFDRNGYRYHGRLQALAEAARESGLKF